MKRIIGLDLGTKTCGVSISDKTLTLASSYTLLRFEREDYKTCFEEIKKIVEKENITDICIGVPINMDGTKGFAYERSQKLIEFLKSLNINIVEIDERLTTMMAKNNLHNCNIKEKDFKDKVDIESANLILETYLRRIKG